MKSIFTIPKIVKADSWYIYFRYDKKLFRYKYGINYIKDLAAREKEAVMLRDALHSKLKQGWNPLVPDLESIRNDMLINDALDFAFEKKKEAISKRTADSYSYTLNFFKQAVIKLRLDNMKIQDVKRVHIKTIFEKIKTDRNWSNKSYNKNMGYIKAVFSELIQWDKIENNPVYNIRSLKVNVEEANVVATDEQIEIIKKHIQEKFPNFYNYFVTIFHTGMRPEEILSIKVSMVDLNNCEIKIPASITKTDIHRIVPINKHMQEYLEPMVVSSESEDYFLFGSIREHTNRGLKKDEDFRPGPRKLNRDAASKLWRKLVKEELEINVNMYSMKHLGANKKINAGIELDTLRELYGHTSKMMTKRYAKNVTQVYRKQIMDMSPDL